MFRQSLAARACLALALGLTCPPPGVGSGAVAYERLDRLERDLNMLQRHVYRGATVSAPDGGAAVNAQSAWIGSKPRCAS